MKLGTIAAVMIGTFFGSILSHFTWEYLSGARRWKRAWTITGWQGLALLVAFVGCVLEAQGWW